MTGRDVAGRGPIARWARRMWAELEVLRAPCEDCGVVEGATDGWVGELYAVLCHDCYMKRPH